MRAAHNSLFEMMECMIPRTRVVVSRNTLIMLALVMYTKAASDRSSHLP